MKKINKLLTIIILLIVNNVYSQSNQDTTINKTEYYQLVEEKNKVQYYKEQIENYNWILETKDILIDFFRQRIQALETEIKSKKRKRK
jgi:hypothetical protein